MEIRVLNYFLTVAREESITKASEVLHITQPTLSRQLAQMEEEMGVRLFDRGSRKIRLTNEGMLLRRRAEEILQLVEKTERELSGQEGELEGIVSIGCGELASTEILAELCGAFRERFPRVRFDLYTATADVVRERIERGIDDMGLLLEPVDMERFEFVRLSRKERWAVVLRAEDPLAAKEAVTAEDLTGLPLSMPRRTNVMSELANWFGDRFAGLNVAYTANLSTNAAVLAQQGYCYPVVVEGALPFWDPARLVTRPLFPELSATSVLAWKRGQPFGAAAGRFMEFAKEYLHTISSAL